MFDVLYKRWLGYRKCNISERVGIKRQQYHLNVTTDVFGSPEEMRTMLNEKCITEGIKIHLLKNVIKQQKKRRIQRSTLKLH